LDFIKENGIKNEGIFRVSGSKNDLILIKKKLNSNETIDFDEIQSKYGIEIVNENIFNTDRFLIW
jgi:hypothetical protein